MNHYGGDLLSMLNSLPPYQCRLLASNGRRPLSTSELAQKAELSTSVIKVLARADSWLHFELKTILKFTSACGVDLLHQKYPKQRLRRMMQSERGPIHLTTRQRKYFRSLFTGEKNWRRKP